MTSDSPAMVRAKELLPLSLAAQGKGPEGMVALRSWLELSKDITATEWWCLYVERMCRFPGRFTDLQDHYARKDTTDEQKQALRDLADWADEQAMIESRMYALRKGIYHHARHALEHQPFIQSYIVRQ